MQEQIKDRIINNKKSSEDVRLLANAVIDICRILSKIEREKDQEHPD